MGGTGTGPNLTPSSVNQYMMLKALQSPTYIGALAKPFQKAARDLVSDRLAERAPGYIESVLYLTKRGNEALKEIRNSPEVADFEQLAKITMDAEQPKIDAMREKLFPNFNS